MYRPQCQNSSDVEGYLENFYTKSHTVDVSVATVMVSLFGITGVLGNTLAVAVYLKYQPCYSAHHFIKVMALSDLFVCAFVIPYRLYSYHVTVAEAACKMFEALTYFSCMYSAVLLIIVAIDRWVCNWFYMYSRIIKLKNLKIYLIDPNQVA